MQKSVIFGKPATYRGIKEIEAKPSDLPDAVLVIRQDYRGAKTWTVLERYYVVPNGEKWPVRVDRPVARGLPLRQARRFTADLLSRAVGVETNGKILFAPRVVR